MMIISKFRQREITIVPACSSFASGGRPDGGFSVIAQAVRIFIVSLLLGSGFNEVVYADDSYVAIKC